MLSCNFSEGYEEALNRLAGEIGNEQTRVKEYSCARDDTTENAIRVTVKMDKQSCLVQADVLTDAIDDALNFSAFIPEHNCFRDINAGLC